MWGNALSASYRLEIGQVNFDDFFKIYSWLVLLWINSIFFVGRSEKIAESEN